MMAVFVRNLPSSDPHHPFKNVPLFDETTTKVRKLVEKKMVLADKEADGTTIKVELFYLGLEDAQKYGHFLVYNVGFQTALQSSADQSSALRLRLGHPDQDSHSRLEDLEQEIPTR